jgi:hypothetical protein
MAKNEKKAKEKHEKKQAKRMGKVNRELATKITFSADDVRQILAAYVFQTYGLQTTPEGFDFDADDEVFSGVRYNHVLSEVDNPKEFLSAQHPYPTDPDVRPAALAGEKP